MPSTKKKQNNKNQKHQASLSGHVLQAALIIIVVGFVAYHNSFQCEFILDSYSKIIQDPRIHQLWPISRVIEESNRPIIFITFAVNYAISGMNVLSYHVLNFLVHILAGLTLFGIIRRTLGETYLAERYGSRATGLAAFIALLWVIHPLQTESVTYIYQRSESIMSLFFLLTLYCLIRYLGSQKGVWQAAAILMCAFGMASKAIMVTAPIIYLFYDRTFWAGSYKEILKKRKWLYPGLMLTWFILIKLLMGPHESQGTAGFDMKDLTVWQYMVSQPQVILHYIRLVFWPHPLVLDYMWPIAQAPADIALPAMFIGGLLILTLWAVRYRPALGFLAVWFFLILAPSSSFIPIADLAFEHRIYLPLAGFITLVVFLFDVIVLEKMQSREKKKYIIFFFVFAIVPVLILRTIARNRDYQNRQGMWKEVVRYRPRNSRALYNLGLTYLAERRLDEALDNFLKATAINPDYVMAYNNMGNIYYEKGMKDEAVRNYEKALSFEVIHPEVYNNYGVVLMDTEDYEKAEQYLKMAKEYNPNAIDAEKNLGNLYYLTNDLEKAVLQYQKVLARRPDHHSARYSLATIYLTQGKLNQAKNEMLFLTRNQPESPVAQNTLGEVYLQLKDYKSAAFHFQQALTSDSDFKKAQENLDVISALKNALQEETEGQK